MTPRSSSKPASTPRRRPPAPRLPPVHPFDAAHGTDTGGLIPREGIVSGHANDPHLTAYYAVATSILDGLIDLWLSTRPLFPIDRYTFVDIGAGKGRAVMAASLHPFREVVGIELNPTLARIALANLAAFAASASPLSPARILTGDALAVPLPAGPILAFMFHPFEAPLMRRFVRRIEEAIPPGTAFDLLYVNAEHSSILDFAGSFTRLFHGLVPMSAADHLADLAEIAEQTDYGSTGDELCAIYRFTGPPSPTVPSQV